MMNTRGLTLIELLIVVSIVTILSGIAMENMAAAKVRSMISRNYSDFRAMATAIEAYAVDHNQYPRMAHYSMFKDPSFDIVQGSKVKGILSHCISTPVAYLTQAYLMDPFMERAFKAPVEERFYTYQNIATYREFYPNSKFWPEAEAAYGKWRLGGVGPDLRFDHGFANSAQLLYDPTNGLISLGNIWHSPKGISPSAPK